MRFESLILGFAVGQQGGGRATMFPRETSGRNYFNSAHSTLSV